MTRTISIVVRTKNEVESIGRLLDIVAAQELPAGWAAEVIVVDSGSTDGTADIVRARQTVRLLEIPASAFTFGGALNIGSEAATGEIHVALSAHAFPPDAGWLATMIRAFDDPAVCCATGGAYWPTGEAATAPIRQDCVMVEQHPEWGYSNGAGGYRADLWRRRPWRPDMPGTEDKEWAWFWTGQGYHVLIDPALVTEHEHGYDPLRDTYRRHEREWRGFASYLDLPPYGTRQALRDWLDPRATGRRGSPRRGAKALGRWVGSRARPDRLPAPGRLDVVVMAEHFPKLSETFVISEAAALRRAGHDVHVIARHPAPMSANSAAEGLPVSGVHASTRPERARALLWLAARHTRACLADLRDRRRWQREEQVLPLRTLAPVARALARRPEAHLHAHFARESALDALRLSRLIGRSWSVTAHAYDIYLSPANLAEKLRRADFATSGCAYTVRDLREIAGPRAADRVHEIVMGVDPAAWQRTRPLPGGLHVLAVGRLVPKKGFADLVRAVGLLRDAKARVRVTVIGDGPERGPLEREIASLGLEDAVTLAGAAPPVAVRAALEEADVLCTPCVVAADGDRDSMPVVVKEAMAMEVPVVASDAVGLPEIVRPPWGRLARAGDAADLAAQLRGVLDASPEERAAMGAAGRAHVVEHAHVDLEAERLAALITAAQARRVRPRRRS